MELIEGLTIIRQQYKYFTVNKYKHYTISHLYYTRVI